MRFTPIFVALSLVAALASAVPALPPQVVGSLRGKRAASLSPPNPAVASLFERSAPSGEAWHSQPTCGNSDPCGMDSVPLSRVKKRLPRVPQFGDLPDATLAHHHRPFSYTGLDYFGPVDIAVGPRREKRWVALFTCLTTMAVHLEIVESLSADSAIMALGRFIARRGCPLKIISDNRTAFVGAANQLHSVFDFAACQQIEWAFIQLEAPNMGGTWERLVRSIKAALATTLKEKAPREEVLGNLLMVAETVVNSHPLTHVPVDPETLQVLTPFHLQLRTSTESVKPGSDADLTRRLDQKKALRLAEVFWSRWVHKYLPTLISKKAGLSRSLVQVVDPVLIAYQNLPRGNRPRRRIRKIFTGHGGTWVWSWPPGH